jgi:hypothetical protein
MPFTAPRGFGFGSRLELGFLCAAFSPFVWRRFAVIIPGRRAGQIRLGARVIIDANAERFLCHGGILSGVKFEQARFHQFLDSNS